MTSVDAIEVELPADLMAAMLQFISDECPDGTTINDAVLIGLRDWLTSIGLLPVQPTDGELN